MSPELSSQHLESTPPNRLECNRRQAIARLNEALQDPEESSLREHQMSMIASVLLSLQHGHHAGYINSATRTGKSAVAATLAEAIGLPTLIISPTLQIEEQNKRQVERFAPTLRVTSYDGRRKDLSGDLVVTTYSSVLSLVGEKKDESVFDPNSIGLVICDEGDLGLGEKQHTIYRHFPNAIKIALTATPHFTPLEGFIARGIVDKDEEWTQMFTNPIHELSLEEAFERGILTPANIYLVGTNIKVPEIEILSTQEYKQSDLEKYLAIEARNVLVIGMVAGVDKIQDKVRIDDKKKKELHELHQKIKAKPTAILGISIDHITTLEKELQSRGIAAAAIHSQLLEGRREEILDDYKAGKIQVVLGVDMLGRGWDAPHTEVTIHTRPNYSGRRVVHEFGRGLTLSPETGKKEAFAIQLVDEFEKRRQSPVVFTDIFDPEYVLRGATTGKKPSGFSGKPEKSLVTFSGADIDFFIEEARTRELLKTRFTKGSIEEVANFLYGLVESAMQEDPNLQTYELFKMVVHELPERIPIEAQQKAFQAIASMDTNVKRVGREVALLLNMKTLLTVVDSYFREEADGEEDRDEMIHAATVSVLEKLSNLSPNLSIPQQIHSAATSGVTEYLAKKDNMPVSWIRRESKTRAIIATKIEEAFVEGNRILTNEEISSLASELSGETGIDEKNLKNYLNYMNSLREKKEETSEDPVRNAISYSLKEAFDEVMKILTDREKRVLELRFGLEDGEERSLEEVGIEFGVTGERARQIEAKALRKLRHRNRSGGRLRDFIDEKYGRDSGAEGYIRFPQAERQNRRWEPESPYSPHSISMFFLDRNLEEKLTKSGIKELGDLFSASPQKLLEEWTGEPEDLKAVVSYILGYLGVGDNSIVESHRDLLYHIADAIVYRHNVKPTGLPIGYRKALYRKAYNELLSFFKKSLS